MNVASSLWPAAEDRFVFENGGQKRVDKLRDWVYNPCRAFYGKLSQCVAPSDDKQIAKSSPTLVERDCLRTNYEGAAPPEPGRGRAVSIGGAE